MSLRSIRAASGNCHDFCPSYDLRREALANAYPLRVMAGLVPAIHVFLHRRARGKTWMAATSAAMATWARCGEKAYRFGVIVGQVSESSLAVHVFLRRKRRREGLDRRDNSFYGISHMSRIKGAALDLSRDREKALAMFDVSRETVSRLDHFVELLLAWQSKINLISPSTVASLWTRHVADSLQLLHLVWLPPPAAGSSSPGSSRRSRPGGHSASYRDGRDEPGHDPVGRPGEGREEGGVWFDLGSGGGFPGIVIACALAEIPGTRVHLVESNMKKASFLREAVRETKVPAIVHAARIETLGSTFAGRVDYVTARALAPLPELLEWIAPFMKRGAKALLLKGQDLDSELTKATKNWNIEADIVPSKTSRAGRILIVRGLSRRLPHAPLPGAPEG